MQSKKLVGEFNMNVIDQFLIEAAKKKKRKARTKMIKRSKQSQLNVAGGRAAMRMAKQKDPMYKRYKYHRDKMLKLKQQLMKKYAKRGMRSAKKSLM